MKLAALDLETDLIQPGLLTPPPVIGSYADDDGRVLLVSSDNCVELLAELCRGHAVLAGANLVYDVGVILAHAERSGQYPQELLELVFAKWSRDGEVHDVLICEALHAIACGHLFRQSNGAPLVAPGTGEQVGRYSLDVVCDLVLGRKTAKANDFWRERYAILRHVPLSEWPDEARQYPLDDAVNTRDVAQAQLGFPRVASRHEFVRAKDGDREVDACLHCYHVLGYEAAPECKPRVIPGTTHRNIEGLGRECRADLALHLGALWGLRANRAWVEGLRDKVEAQHAVYLEQFREFHKWGHEPGCLKRMAAAGVTPEQARALGPRLGPDGKKVAPTPYCVTSCTDGKEDGPLVTRLVAQAYGATGKCPACGGTGRRVGAKGNPVGCAPRNFKHEVNPVTCDCTGLDLSTARGMPRTETGGVQCDRDALLESGDERLMAYGDDEFEKVRRTYVPFLTRAVEHPLTLSPNVLLETFRVSYNGPVQQMPREGEARTAFEARPGLVYSSSDYSGVELCTLAQVCLWTVGFSRMAEIINETGDPGGLHAAFGAQMLGLPVDEMKRRIKAGDKVAKDFRQGSKKANFGFGGCMGPATFVLQQREKKEGKTYSPEGPNADAEGRFYWGVRFCILLGGATRCGTEKITEWKGRECPPVCKACVLQADILRRNWLDFFPEMPRYFDYVKQNVDAHGEVRLPFPGSTRGGVRAISEGANGHFQELAALLAKTALWRVTRECYVDSASPLYRTTRIPFFVHDEIFAEMLIDAAPLAAPRIGTIMVEAGRDIVPDVKLKVDPAISRRWLKAMEAAYDDEQRLIPWEDGAAGRKYLAEKGWQL